MPIVRDDITYWVAPGHEWFWPTFADGTWEPNTFKIFDRFLDKDKTFVDIGAWIGPTVLYAAQRAKQVFAFEPDTVAYSSLCQNLDLNKVQNVIPYTVAVTDSWKGLPFGAKTRFGDSMSSELWGSDGKFKVPAISLEAVVIDLQPNFIKIDIEGGEKTIFSGTSMLALDEMKPTIHLSLHTPWFLDDIEDFKKPIIEGLSMYPYFYDENLKPIKLEDAFNPNAFNSVIATFKKIV